MKIQKVIKRSGKAQGFEMAKIAKSVRRAGKDTGEYAMKEARSMMKEIEKELESLGKKAITVEEIRNVVEPLIAKAGFFKTAKHYILYGSTKHEARSTKREITEPQLTEVAAEVVAKRYLRTDMNGRVLETPGELFWRVAHHMAKAEITWGSNGIVEETASQFFERMVNFKFVCAGKAMFEAGNPGGTGQLSSCFVLPIDDNIETIFKTLGEAAVVHKNNGGTGFNFSKIRPHGDKVKNVPKASSGPVDFLRAYSAALSQILQGAKRQGANIAILNADHPDIEEFIRLKSEDGTIKNFNISVGVTNAFMEAVVSNKDWELKNPRNGEVWKTVKARALFDLIAEYAWATGDPGLCFLDRLEEDNPTPSLGRLEATNPCITGDALIPTSEGLLRLDALVALTQTSKKVGVVVDRRLAITNSASAVLQKAVCTGKKPVFMLKTVHGFTVKATGNHRIMTTEGWKEMVALTKSDRVLIQQQEGVWPRQNSLKQMATFSRKYPESYPVTADRKLGEVLGYLVGDGSVRADERDAYVILTYGSTREGLQGYFNKLLLGWKIQPTVRKPNNRSVQLYVHSPVFSQFLLDLGVSTEKAAGKTLPEVVYTWPKLAVIGFLRGLFSADGTVGFVPDKSAYIRLTSKSIKLLEQVQLLLLQLNIFSKIYNRTRVARQDLFPPYRRKDGTVTRYSSDGVLFELEISKDQVLRFLDVIGFIGELHKEKIVRLRSKTYFSQKFEDQVETVTPAGEELVYDLTEPLTHSFLANGVVVHNCGEIPLLPYESCNLTSIVLSNHLVEKKGAWEIDWDDLERSVKLGVRFLDNMIEMNAYPLESIRQMVKEGNRRIGLGVMGFAHMLNRMGIAYDSSEAVRMSERLAKFIRQKAEETSLQLSRERGPFPNFDRSVYAGSAERYRNCALLMIAPTGTTSLVANASSGIEPVFSLVTVRRSFNEDNRKNAPTKEFMIVDPELEKLLDTLPETRDQKSAILKKIMKYGLSDVEGLPKWVYKTYVTTHEIAPEWHVKIQAAWQKWIDNSVSKTINFSHTATAAEVKEAYLQGWRLGLKGITIYRDGSKMDQVLNVAGKESKMSKDASIAKETCPECGGACTFADGCVSCPNCGWSKCSM